MRSLLRLKNPPALLAFLLLAMQVAVFWAGRRFLTQDGPSHLYNAVVARELLLASRSPYAAIYQVAPGGSNWGTVAVFNLAALAAGEDHAEQLAASLGVLAGFFSLAYFLRALSPGESPWTPLLNFCLSAWFLWAGYYNFYFSMLLSPLLAGYFLRRASVLSWRQTLLLGLGTSAQFVVHPLPAAITVGVLCCLAVWLRGAARLWRLAAALLPVCSCLTYFLVTSQDSAHAPLNLAGSWRSFPNHVFAAARGASGEQLLLSLAMLFYFAVGLASMRKAEWRGVRGAMALAAGGLFAGYFLAPDYAFHGGQVKIRLSWAMYMFGCLTAWSTLRMRPLRTAVAVFVACGVAAMLAVALEQNVRGVSAAGQEYIALLDRLPDGATFVRLRYPAEQTQRRFGFPDVALDPLTHVDSLVAARRRLIDLSDYQAVAQTFPVRFRDSVAEGKRWELADLEGNGPDGSKSLRSLLSSAPIPIDCVVVLGDGGADRAETLAWLERTMVRVGRDLPVDFAQAFCRSPVPTGAGRASVSKKPATRGGGW